MYMDTPVYFIQFLSKDDIFLTLFGSHVRRVLTQKRYTLGEKNEYFMTAKSLLEVLSPIKRGSENETIQSHFP